MPTNYSWAVLDLTTSNHIKCCTCCGIKASEVALSVLWNSSTNDQLIVIVPDSIDSGCCWSWGELAHYGIDQKHTTNKLIMISKHLVVRLMNRKPTCPICYDKRTKGKKEIK